MAQTPVTKLYFDIVWVLGFGLAYPRVIMLVGCAYAWIGGCFCILRKK